MLKVKGRSAEKLRVAVKRKYTHIKWVAVKELKLSYFLGETLLFIIYMPIMVT